MLRPHVVILGAGFGGTYVAKKLAAQVKKGKIDVTIVNKTNYFLFTPLLHEVATGSLSPMSVAEPLREVFVNTGIELCQGNVQEIDIASHRVHISSNGARHTLPYDYLVLATGAVTNYYGISGAEKYTFPLKTLADAVRIRTRIIDCFEEAIMAEDPAERARLLSFVVIGGGPTGVETVAELSEFVHGIVDRYYHNSDTCRHEEVKVTLIHAGTELLQTFSPSLRTATEKKLQSDGVILRLNSTVTNVTSHGLTLTSDKAVPKDSATTGDTISSATIIWTAGVKPVIPDFVGVTPTLVKGRLVTDEFFRLNLSGEEKPKSSDEKNQSSEKLLGDERVFALGDIAGSLPMLAQASVQQASIVAHNVLASIDEKPLSKLEYLSRGSMVSVGQWFAVGEIFQKSYYGHWVWWLWRTVYLFKFASWKKRVRIAFDWTLQIFSSRDITKFS